MPVPGQVDQPEPQAPQLELQSIERTGGRVGQVGGDEDPGIVACLGDELGVEGFLGLEVGVEGAHRKLGPTGDFVDVGLEVALLPEEAAAGAQQALAHPLVQGYGQGLGRATEDLGRIEGQALVHAIQEQVAHGVEVDAAGPGGCPNRAEAEAPGGKQDLTQARLPPQGRAQGPGVDAEQAPLVLEVAVLAFPEHRDQVPVLLGEAEQGLGQGAHPLPGRASTDPLQGVPHLVQHPAQDHLEERFLAVEVAVEDPVGQARFPTDLRH